MAGSCKISGLAGNGRGLIKISPHLVYLMPPPPNLRPSLIKSGGGNMAASLPDEDLQPIMLNSIALSGAAIQAFSDPLKKIHYYGSKWIANANKRSFAYAGFGLKCFISYCYIICISSCASAKQTTPACRLRLSTALYGKLHALEVKTIRADVCW